MTALVASAARRVAADRRRHRRWPSSSRASRCACSACGAGWGTALLAGVRRLGRRGRRRPRASATGTGAPTGWSLHLVGDRHPGDDGRRGRARPARPARLAGHRRAGRPRRRAPTRARRARGGSPCSAATASWSACARREGFGPFAVGRRPRRPPTSQAVRLRRVLEEAGGVYVKLGQIAATRVDLLPAEVCAELADAAEPGAARAARARSPPCSRPSSATVDAIFAEFDWEPLAAASIGQTHRARAAHRRGRRRQGPAAGHRGDDGARPRRAGAARRPRPAAHAVRPGRALRRHARPVRRGPARRARLPPRGRRDGRDGGAARRRAGGARARRCTAQLCTRRRPRAGALRGLHGRRRRAARRARASTAPRSADQLLRSTLDQVHAARLLPRRSRTRATCSCSTTARSGSSTSAPSAASTRSSRRRSSTCSSPWPGATSACCATASSGSPTSPRRRRPTSSSGRWPG